MAGAGGTATITGGSVTTNNEFSPGLYASGAGANVTTTGTTPTIVTTTGDNSAGVQADTGGQVTLNGGSVTASGSGSP